jgi:hypothetical protein
MVQRTGILLVVVERTFVLSSPSFIDFVARPSEIFLSPWSRLAALNTLSQLWIGWNYEVGQARIACPTVCGGDFSRDVLDADRGTSRAHPRGDHDDRILDRDCLGGYHACHS